MPPAPISQLSPSMTSSRRIALFLAGVGIAVIATTMVVGPFFAPSEFSLLSHSTSEQAAQGLEGAWIMRTGVVAYGLAIILASLVDRSRRPMVRIALATFGAGLLAAALWSNASISRSIASDMAEDRLRSIASGVVGTAFRGCLCGAPVWPRRLSA